MARANRDIACTRGELTVGQDVFTITGENGDATPRKAVARRADGPMAFIAPYMDLSAFLSKEKPANSAKYILVVLDAKSARALRLYTALPADEALSREFAAALRGGIPPLASTVPGKQGVTAYVQAEPTRPKPPQPITPPSAVPAPGAGGVGTGALSGPDGEVFLAEGDGARHAMTGFVCPMTLNGRHRDRLLVFDRSDHGRDVGCGYGSSSDGSWFTVYLTKIPGMRAGKVFDAYESEAKAAAPPVGRAQPPLKAGSKPPAPKFASFWKNSHGAIDGLWMSQIGDWNIKLRATFRPEDEAEAKAMAEAVFAAVYEQVKPEAI